VIEGIFVAGALAGFALFVLLGSCVARVPFSWDASAASLRGGFTQAAIVFTKSGRSAWLTAFCIAAFVFFAVTRRPLWIPAVMTASQVLSQIVIEAVKPLYGRVRPDYWLVGLDPGHSYPSGHSATSVIFFSGWGAVALLSGLPPFEKYAVAAALAVWALGICWSRLALGAHYLSDVCGGIAFGTGWLCALFAIVLQLRIVSA
jgi:undecaprenyl-diphosphatase